LVASWLMSPSGVSSSTDSSSSLPSRSVTTTQTSHIRAMLMPYRTTQSASPSASSAPPSASASSSAKSLLSSGSSPSPSWPSSSWPPSSLPSPRSSEPAGAGVRLLLLRTRRELLFWKITKRFYKTENFRVVVMLKDCREGMRIYGLWPIWMVTSATFF
jgi:hypothetical protein